VPGTLRSYLYKAARNRALTSRRHAAVEARFREQVTLQQATGHRPQLLATPADQEAHISELAAIIARSVEQLPPRCREVFELNRKHHLSYAEIAGLLQISARTVEVHMGRALAVLRRALIDWR
jgi:RNA polymerase sigma-70 factor (ECF subfamily)